MELYELKALLCLKAYEKDFEAIKIAIPKFYASRTLHVDDKNALFYTILTTFKNTEDDVLRGNLKDIIDVIFTGDPDDIYYRRLKLDIEGSRRNEEYINLIEAFKLIVKEQDKALLSNSEIEYYITYHNYDKLREILTEKNIIS